MPTPNGTREVLEFGVASQLLAFEAPQGRPSGSGTVSIYDPRSSPTASPNPLVNAGTATLNSVTTTLNGSVNPLSSDPTSIPLASTTGILVGDHLWLTNAAGETEQIEVLGVTAAVVFSCWPVTLTHITGALCVSSKMTSPALSTAWVSDVANLDADFYAIWSYTVAGISYRARTSFDLCRAAPQFRALSARVFERWPGLKKFAFPDHPGGFEQIARAAFRDVANLLRLRGIDPAKFRGGYDLQDWLAEVRLSLLLAENGVSPNKRDIERFVDARTAEWGDLLAQFTNGVIPVPYDGDDNDQISDGERGAMLITLSR